MPADPMKIRVIAEVSGRNPGGVSLSQRRPEGLHLQSSGEHVNHQEGSETDYPPCPPHYIGQN